MSTRIIAFGKLVSPTTASGAKATGTAAATGGAGGPSHILPRTATFGGSGVTVEVPPPSAAPIGASMYEIEVKYAWSTTADLALAAVLKADAASLAGSPFNAATGVPATVIEYPEDPANSYLGLIYRVRTISGDAHDRLIQVYQNTAGGVLRLCAGLEGRLVKSSAASTVYFIWQPAASANGLAGKSEVPMAALTSLFGSAPEILEMDSTWVTAMLPASVPILGTKSFLILDLADGARPVYLVHAETSSAAAATRYRLEPKLDVAAYTGLGGGAHYTSTNGPSGAPLVVSTIGGVGLDIPYCETWPGF